MGNSETKKKMPHYDYTLAGNEVQDHVCKEKCARELTVILQWNKIPKEFSKMIFLFVIVYAANVDVYVHTWTSHWQRRA